MGREYADTLTLGAGFEAAHAWIKAALFQRNYDDLVDWTFSQSAPSLRQANPVNLDVNGLAVAATGSGGGGHIVRVQKYMNRSCSQPHTNL